MLLTYALRRILAAIPVLFIVTFITFLLMYLVPGDPAQVILGDTATPERIEDLRRQLGLDRPFLIQYLSWLGNVLHGNLGSSPFLNESVGHVVAQRASVSFTLAVAAEILAVVLGLSLGVVAALRKGTLLDRIISVVSGAGLSIPNFVVAIVLVVVFAVNLGWLPPTGFVAPWTDPVGSLKTIALPVLALSMKQTALIARMMRGSMIEVLEREYMVSAVARNVGRVRTVVRHALPNALGPTITIIGVGFGSLISGMLIVEVVFGIPGLGRAVIDGVHSRDLVLLQGVVLVVTALYIFSTLLADIAHAWLNPRLKME